MFEAERKRDWALLMICAIFDWIVTFSDGELLVKGMPLTKPMWEREKEENEECVLGVLVRLVYLAIRSSR